MRKISLLPVLAALLGGCATVSPQAQRLPPSPIPASRLENSPHAKAEKAQADLLYQVLLAEVAGHRGQLDTSAVNYLKVAEETRAPAAAKRATQIAVYARQYPLALRAAQLWTEVAPKAIDAHQALAALLIQEGNVEEATPELAKVIALSGEHDGHGYLLAARLLGAANQPGPALAAMDRLVAVKPDNPEAVYAYAELAHKVGDSKQALTLADRLLKLEPRKPRALALKGEVLSQMGRHREALPLFRRAVKAAPKDTGNRLNLARELVFVGRVKEARKQFRLLSRRIPDSGELIYAQGLLALQAGDTKAAKVFFHNLIDLGQRSDEAAFSLGEIAETEKQVKDALHWYSRVGSGEHYLDAQIRISVLLVQAKGLDAGLDHLHKIDTKVPRDRLRLRLAEGEILRDAGKQGRALALYESALKDFPADSDLLYAHAMTAEELGRLDVLEQDLKTILKHDPENVQALNALGYTLADHDTRLTEAHDYISHALRLKPDDPAILDSMGWVLHRMGRNKEAVGFLRKALDNDPDGEIAAHLGEVLWQLGRHDEARKVWREASKKDPANKVLKRTIQRYSQ